MRAMRALKFGLPLALACISAAAAQTFPGQTIVVNPSAAGSRMLLYPGGKYGRVQHELLQPGDPGPWAPIHLHMPRRHVARHVEHRATRLAEAPEPMTPTYIPQDSASGLTVTDAPIGAVPAAPRAAAPARVASVEPPPVDTTSMAQHRAILFAPGQTDPMPAALNQLKAMAGDLNVSLTSAAARVQLLAYGGGRGDKSSDARRLSLKRALIVRQLLIDSGVPSERIDVRAMGGAEGGPPDRVDIFVRA